MMPSAKNLPIIISVRNDNGLPTVFEFRREITKMVDLAIQTKLDGNPRSLEVTI